MNENGAGNTPFEDEDGCESGCEREVTLGLDDFLVLNGDEDDAELEAKQRKASDWFLLGTRAYVHAQYDLAITYFDKVLELEPENAKAYANRADVHWEMEEYPEAHNDYLMAVELGGEKMQSLLDEFIQAMQAEKLMDRQGTFTQNVKSKQPSHLPLVDEADLGEDMRIFDPKEEQAENEDDEDLF